MSNKKISQLEAINEYDGEDLLVVVDVSTGETKKQKKTDLFADVNPEEALEAAAAAQATADEALAAAEDAQVDATQALNDAGGVQTDLDAHIADTSNPHAVTKAQVGLGNVTNDAQIPLVQKGAALGVATLDATGQLTSAQIPASLLGSVQYQGLWNASTNTPGLASGVGSKGSYYIVSVAGSTALDGITDWKLGDWAIFNGTTWDKVDNTDAVISVNGFLGSVSLTTDNIPEGATNKYSQWSAVTGGINYSGGFVGINNSSPLAFLTITASTVSATTGNQIRLESFAGSIASGSLIGGIDFVSRDTQIPSPGVVSARIQVVGNRAHIDGVADADIVFYAVGGISTTLVERMRIAANGVGLGASPSVSQLKFFTLLGALDGFAFGDATYNIAPPAGGGIIQGRVGIGTTSVTTIGTAVTSQVSIVNSQTAASQNTNNTLTLHRGGTTTTGTVLELGAARTSNAAFNLISAMTGVGGTPVTAFLVRGDATVDTGSHVTIGTTQTTPFLYFGGTTSAHVAIRRQSDIIQVKLGDNSGYATFDAGAYRLGGSTVINTVSIYTPATSGRFHAGSTGGFVLSTGLPTATPDTGISRHSAGVVRINNGEYNGDGLLYVGGAGNNYFAGNVGIGIAAPSAVLHVYGGTLIQSTTATNTLSALTNANLNNPQLTVVTRAATGNYGGFHVYTGGAASGTFLTSEGITTGRWSVGAAFQGASQYRPTTTSASALEQVGGALIYSYSTGLTQGTVAALTELFRVNSNGRVGVGTASPTALLDVNSDTLRLRTAKTPATAGATGNQGDICWDTDWVYVAVATNTWKRASLATW